MLYTTVTTSQVTHILNTATYWHSDKTVHCHNLKDVRHTVCNATYLPSDSSTHCHALTDVTHIYMQCWQMWQQHWQMLSQMDWQLHEQLHWCTAILTITLTDVLKYLQLQQQTDNCIDRLTITLTDSEWHWQTGDYTDREMQLNWQTNLQLRDWLHCHIDKHTERLTTTIQTTDDTRRPMITLIDWHADNYADRSTIILTHWWLYYQTAHHTDRLKMTLADSELHWHTDEWVHCRLTIALAITLIDWQLLADTGDYIDDCTDVHLQHEGAHQNTSVSDASAQTTDEKQ